MTSKSSTPNVSPFAHLRATVAVVALYLLVLVAWLTAGGRWPGGRWFGVHLFTLGVVTNLVLAMSDHFARALTHHGGRRSGWHLLVTNAGVLAILLGIPSGTAWLVATGATVLVVEVMRSYVALRRLRTRSLAGRFSWVVRVYERADGAFVHGAILGALMGTGALKGSWWSSARIAHLHVNVLGWAGLTLLATIVFFGPTVVRTRIEPGADVRAAKVLPWAASALTLAVLALFGSGAGGVWATPMRLVAAAGLLVYAWSVAEVGLPVILAARRARPSAGRLALAMVLAWFAIVVGLDVLVVATAAWQYLDALGVAMLTGVLLQAIAMSLGYFAPLLLAADATARAKLSARIDRLATARTVCWNIGVTAASLAAAVGEGARIAGSITARAGWATILATTIWLAAAILIPSRRASREATDARRP